MWRPSREFLAISPTACDWWAATRRRRHQCAFGVCGRGSISNSERCDDEILKRHVCRRGSPLTCMTKQELWDVIHSAVGIDVQWSDCACMLKCPALFPPLRPSQSGIHGRVLIKPQTPYRRVHQLVAQRPPDDQLNEELAGKIRLNVSILMSGASSPAVPHSECNLAMGTPARLTG
jgi:hypothetical protein